MFKETFKFQKAYNHSHCFDTYSQPKGVISISKLNQGLKYDRS